MRLLDLFAGIGGFSLAGHWMGWETAAFVEKEPFCQKVLRKNFGAEIEIHNDIFNFTGEPFRGRIDIVTGGFPCQPFSAAGKRKGRHDERHLFPEMLRVIREVRPRWVVAENVRGLLSIESGRVFAEVIASLESEGFEVVTFCVPASAVNAWHRRDRLWFVAFNAKCYGRSGAPRLRGIETAVRKEPTWSFNPFDLERADCLLDAPDAENVGLQRGVGPRGTEGAESFNEFLDGRDRTPSRWRTHWIEAATRFCRMDYGIPQRVDRLKALGNSIVPQIAFEIFRAIEAADSE